MNVVAFLFIREECRFYVGALFLWARFAHPNFIHEHLKKDYFHRITGLLSLLHTSSSMTISMFSKALTLIHFTGLR
jgi:hypothetical protein